LEITACNLWDSCRWFVLFTAGKTGHERPFKEERRLVFSVPAYSVDTIKCMHSAETQDVTYGKPAIGGPFRLTDCETGKEVTEQDFLGKFAVIYFGFTHCPDVCPDELEKMSKAISKMDLMPGVGAMVTPIFISVDPKRDTPEAVKTYIKEFHPRFRGLTGTDEQIRQAAKAYRVYYAIGESDGEDYLVDHSIFFFLMDPEGTFLDFYGRQSTAEDIVDKVSKHVRKWDQDKKAGRV
jgi:protein SCO1/2